MLYIYIYIYRNRCLKIIANIHKYILYTYIPGSWHRHPSHGVPCLQAIAEQEVLVRFPMETPVCWWTWTWLAMGLQEVHRGSSGRDRVSSVPLASLSSSSFEAWCLPHLGSPAWLLHSAQCLDFYLNGEGKTEKNVCCWLPYLVISFFQQGNTHHDDFHLCGSGTSSPPVRLGHKVPALLMTVLMRPEDIKFTNSRRSGHHALCERMEAACWQLWQMLKFGSWTSFEIDALVLKPRDLSVEVWARLGWIA